MTMFKNKYRIESTRLPDYDYSSAGFYYVTICTKKMVRFFGEVINEKVCLSEIGKIVKNEWLKIELIRNYVNLDNYIIMPNHLHGIVIIEDQSNARVETHGHASLQSKNQNQFVLQNLSNIIRGFKSSATRKIRESGHCDFAWQPRFYDHIIRTEKSLNKIRNYIKNNPVKWKTDEYYTD